MEYKTPIIYLVFVFFLTFTNSANAQGQQIIDGEIQQVEFDSQLNTLAIVRYYYFYKLDVNHNVVYSKNFTRALKFFVNKNDDIFIFTNEDGSSDGTNATVGSVWRLKSNTDELQHLFYFPRQSEYYIYSRFFMDSDENIFFMTRNGVEFFDSKVEIPIPIAVKNLDQYFLLYEHAEDVDGNVFLIQQNYTNSLVVLTNAEKRKLAPEAVIFPIGEKSVITELTHWNNEIFFAEKVNGGVTNLKKIKKELFGKSEIELILSQYAEYYFVNDIPYKLFVIAKSENDICKFHYIDSDGKFGSTDDKFSSSILNDIRLQEQTFKKDGTGYFVYGTAIVSLKRHETKFDLITAFQEALLYLQTDFNDNVWVLTENNGGRIWAVGNDTVNLIYQAPHMAAIRGSTILFKKETGEIFVAVENGIFVFSNPFDKK